MTDRDPTAVDDAPRDAADWFARLSSEDAGAEDWAGFDAWLAAHQSHEPAFRAVESLWLDLDHGGASASVPGKIKTPSSAEILQFKPQLKTKPRPGDKVWAGAAAAGLAAVTLMVASGLQFLGGPPAETSLYVPQGQTRTLALPGGSATVEGGGRLALVNTPKGPRVRLQSGSATFHLQHDPARRLTVLAGGEQITDIGTVFSTRLSADALWVTVSEGEVEVQPASSPGQPLRVHAGQALVRRASETSSRVLGAGLTPLRRPYQNTSLAEVVADLNQFYSRPITIADKNSAGLRFTGVLVLDSEEAVVRRLEAYLPIAARVSAGSVVLTAR